MRSRYKYRRPLPLAPEPTPMFTRGERAALIGIGLFVAYLTVHVIVAMATGNMS
jgi:hypothetical protein